MAVRTPTKPYVVSAKGAKQIERMLAAPSPLTKFALKSNVMSVSEAIKKYGTKK